MPIFDGGSFVGASRNGSGAPFCERQSDLAGRGKLMLDSVQGCGPDDGAGTRERSSPLLNDIFSVNRKDTGIGSARSPAVKSRVGAVDRRACLRVAVPKTLVALRTTSSSAELIVASQLWAFSLTRPGKENQ